MYGVHARDRYEDGMIGVLVKCAVKSKSETMCCRILAGARSSTMVFHLGKVPRIISLFAQLMDILR